MGWVTKDQLARAREVDVLDYVLTCESGNIQLVGSSYRMKDHPSIEIKHGKWRWYSQGLSGRSAVDYLTDVRGYSLVEAVCTILSEKPQERSEKAQPLPEPERLPFARPIRNGDNKRVLSYLKSRGIDESLILDCIARGDIYENKFFHNAVFIGRDECGKPKYASMRGTLGGFKCDAEGSDKRYGFLLPPSDPDSQAIAVFESPIDCLSHQTMCMQGFIPAFDGWRLSLGGIAAVALEHFLENHPGITHCVICTDNDEVGNTAAENITKLPGVTFTRSLPPAKHNDWNDSLLYLQKTERTKNRTISTDKGR